MQQDEEGAAEPTEKEKAATAASAVRVFPS